MSSADLLVWGSGGFAREVAWLATLCNSSAGGVQVKAFVDDDPARSGQEQNGLPILAADDASECYPSAEVVVALGDPRARSEGAREAEARGHRFATLIHPKVELSPWVEIGEGSVIFQECSLTTNIRLGRHVQLNPGCTIGHDSVLGDCCTLFPGARVSGWVVLGERVLLGAGAVVINGTWREAMRVGDDATVGAAACVTKAVAAGTTVAGVPARLLESSGRRG